MMTKSALAPSADVCPKKDGESADYSANAENKSLLFKFEGDILRPPSISQNSAVSSASTCAIRVARWHSGGIFKSMQ